MEDYEMKQILEKWKHMLDFVDSSTKRVSGHDRFLCASEMEHFEKTHKNNLDIPSMSTHISNIRRKYGKK